MDVTRFDRFVRILATDQTRRGTLRLLGAGLVAGLLTRRAAEPASALQLDGSNGWAICGENELIVNLWTETVHCGSCFHSCWEELASPSGELVVPICDHGVCRRRNDWAIGFVS